MSEVISARIRDRLALDWLTPSQLKVWEEVHHFDGPPHRVINIFGAEGTGKTFIGWLMERVQYATYGPWSAPPKPTLARLVLDDCPTSREAARSCRPLIDQIPGLQQIILLSRTRIAEPAMPAFELTLTEDDWPHFRANIFRHLHLTVPEGNLQNYRKALEALS
jgi:hypothetical protein